jgi:tetratricopeptide (TPR) repeat protein
MGPAGVNVGYLRAQTAQFYALGEDGRKRSISDLVAYPFPTVNAVDCYDVLGVTKSEHVDEYKTLGKRPPYVRRDADHRLSTEFRRGEFVIIAGPSKAGKTRSAYEMLMHRAPNESLVVPLDTKSLPELIESFERLRNRPANSVLWLDDLDRYFRAGGLNARIIRAMHRLGMKIVATIRSNELETWGSMEGDIARDAQDVIDRATVIGIQDRMSGPEKKRAQQLYPKEKFDAGLGESLIAGRKLKRRADHANTAVKAVVHAANDWKRTGMSEPISRGQLYKLFARWLNEIDPQADASGVFEKGLAGALEPVARYSALLLKRRCGEDDHCYEVSDFVSDYLDRAGHEVIEEAWRSALNVADSGPDFHAIGTASYDRRRLDIAKEAWTLGMKVGHAYSAFQLGVLFEERGDINGSEDAYRAAIRADPNLAVAHNNLGNLVDKQGRKGEAEDAYRAAIRADPNLAAAHSNLGGLLRDQGRTQEAEEAYRAAIRTDPGAQFAYYNLGLLLEEKGRKSEAENAFRMATIVKPGRVTYHTDDLIRIVARAYRSLGLLLHERGMSREAENAFRAAIHKDSTYADAYVALGWALEKRGKTGKAEKAYREAFRVDPKCVDALEKLGALLQRKGNVEEAERQFRAAIQIDAQNASVHFRLGLALDKRGQIQLAEEEYRQAICFDANLAGAHYNLGLLLLRRGLAGEARLLEEAKKEYREAIRCDPEDAAAHYSLAFLLESQGLHEEADKESKEAIRYKPNDANAHHWRGLILYKRGLWEEAEEELRKTLELNSNFELAHNSLGMVLLKRGLIKKAEDEFRKAISCNANYARAHKNLGSALMERGMIEEAEKAFRRSAEIESTLVNVAEQMLEPS